ncbi:MAG: cell division protein FtsX [Myxococcota bacterium]
MARLGLFLRMAFSALRRSWAASLLTVVTTSVSLAILGAFGLAYGFVDAQVNHVAKSLVVSAYLGVEVSDAVGRGLAERVQTWPGVETAEYLSSAGAMTAFRQQLGEDAVLLAGLKEDVLPASLEVQLKASHRNPLGARNVADRLDARPEVEEVSYGADRLNRLLFVQRFVRIAFAVLGGALLLGSLLVVANTVRLTVLARQSEIEVLTLVGATSGFIRTPFVMEGLMQGLAGGLLALVWLFGLDEALTASLSRLVGSGPSMVRMDPWIGLMPGLGLLLGGAGSILAVRGRLGA